MKKVILISYASVWILAMLFFLVKEIPLSLLFTNDILLVIHFLWIVILIPILLTLCSTIRVLIWTYHAATDIF